MQTLITDEFLKHLPYEKRLAMETLINLVRNVRENRVTLIASSSHLTPTKDGMQEFYFHFSIQNREVCKRGREIHKASNEVSAGISAAAGRREAVESDVTREPDDEIQIGPSA